MVLNSKYRLLILIFIAATQQNCSCENLFGAASAPPQPIDTSCVPFNPHGQHDPTIPELCDGYDNNCNCYGKPLEEQDTNGDLIDCGYGDEGVDEGCECYPEYYSFSAEWALGERDCWLGEGGEELGSLEAHSNTRGKLYGECRLGKQVCNQLPEGGSQWGQHDDGPDVIGGTEDDIWIPGGCAGAVGPRTDVCDGKDNNCDNFIDEGLKRSCWSGPVDSEGNPQEWIVFSTSPNSFAPCKVGIELCQGGRWSGCMHEILPEPERCDGLDNDCDGVVDDHTEYENTDCGLTDEGVCEYGRLACHTADLMCENALLPQTEVCDNLDNDCDAAVDENLFQPCQTLCGSGLEVCITGTWQDCNARQPEEEICDAADNDCDGLVDEGLECMCPPEFLGMLLPCQSNPRLVCGAGFMQCECVDDECSSTAFTDCQALCVYEPQVQEDCDPTLGTPQLEICNAWDDDCDDEIDEGLFAGCYTGPRGTQNIGQCTPGEVRCELGRWGNESSGIFIDHLCLGQILPEEEVCDNIDNDCDGETDEDLDSHEKVDMVFAIDRSGSMCGVIRALRQGIQPYVLEFANTPHRFALVNIPGGMGHRVDPAVEINLVDSLTFAATLGQLDCDLGNEEPQYDAVVDIAQNNLNLNFRDDAWPMVVMLSDENAQTFRQLTTTDVVATLDPCVVGNCEAGDKLEVFVITPNNLQFQWCAPSEIATQCYDLYNGIDAATVRGYLDDIFSDVCRGGGAP